MRFKKLAIGGIASASLIIVLGLVIISPVPPIKPEPDIPIVDPIIPVVGPIIPEIPTATATETQVPDTPIPGDLITPSLTSTSNPTSSPSSTPTSLASMPNYTVTCGVAYSTVYQRSADDETLVKRAHLFLNVVIDRPVNGEIFQFKFEGNRVPGMGPPHAFELVHILHDGETEGRTGAGFTQCTSTCSGYFTLVSVSVANMQPPASSIPNLEGLNEKCNFTVPGP